MRLARTAVALVAAAVSSATPALAQVVYGCTVSSTPAAPSTSTAAFGSQVTLSATARAECHLLLNLLPAAGNICIQAHKVSAGGSTSFVRSGVTIPYSVTINGVSVGAADSVVFSGVIPAGGQDFPISWTVAAADYGGKPNGNYTATIAWDVFWPNGVCN